MNKIYPWIGFCQVNEPGSGLLEFIEIPRMASLLMATGRYRLLEKSELDQRLSGEMCVKLNRGEVDQIKYWKRSGLKDMRVGDVIFNFWD